jgi:hypothetical protein
VTVTILASDNTTKSTTLKPEQVRERGERRKRRERRRAMNVALRPGDIVTVEATGDLRWTVLDVSVDKKQAELSTTIFSMKDQHLLAPFSEIDVYTTAESPTRRRARRYTLSTLEGLEGLELEPADEEYGTWP